MRQLPVDGPAGVRAPGDAYAEALAETAQSLVCVLAPDGRIVRFNGACEQATGWAADEVIGRDARQVVIPPEEADDFDQMLAEVWATGLGSPQLGHWLTRDGGRRLIAWANRPLFGDDGEPQLLVTAGLDLTERERLRAQLESRLAEQAALRRVATLVAGASEPRRILASVCEEAGQVVQAEAALVARYGGGEAATIVARWNASGLGGFEVGTVVPFEGSDVLVRVHEDAAPARFDDSVVGDPARVERPSGFTSVVGAPIVVAGGLWGALIVASTGAEHLPEDVSERLAAFAELVSLAVASADARERLLESRARIVAAGDAERRRLERNLHDGAQQRLVMLGHAIRLARRKLDSDPGEAAVLLDGAIVELNEAAAELRELARGLHPAVLSDRGLAAALAGAALRVPVPVDLEVADERFPEPVEAAAYYVVVEALTNVARHAEARSARVDVRRVGDALTVRVTDDGKGGATLDAGSGISGLRDRVEALRGTLVLLSPPGRGTTLTAAFPL